MAAMDEGCLDIKQHLDSILKPGCQNQIIIKKRSKQRRRKKPKADENVLPVNHETSANTLSSASVGVNQSEFFLGKEIVDFAPGPALHMKTEPSDKTRSVRDDIVDDGIKKNLTLDRSKNASCSDQVHKRNSFSELLLSVLPNQQASNAQEVEAAHGPKRNNKRRNKTNKKEGTGNKSENNVTLISNRRISDSDQVHEGKAFSDPLTPDLPDEGDDDKEASRGSGKKGARNKVNKREYKKEVVERPEHKKEVVERPEHNKEKQSSSKKEPINTYQTDFQEQLANISPDLKKFLKSEYMFPLEKLFNRFPKAVFHCCLCHYYCSMKDYPVHIKKDNHVKMKNIRDEEYFFRNLPNPSEAQCSELSKLLLKVASEQGLSRSELQERQAVAKRLTEIIQENGLPKCELQVYGSSLSGFGTKDSDINLDLTYSSSLESIPVILSKLQPILETCDDVTDFGTDFQAKVPKIFFKDKRTNLRCSLTWAIVDSVRTSRLLYLYGTLDPRAHVLGVAFKYWARLCEIDCQDKGTFASHAYTLMLVYFLQQVKPAVLPVLHEVFPNLDVDNLGTEENIMKKWKSLNKSSVGELWVNLLRFYAVTFKTKAHIVCLRFTKAVLKTERKWSGSIIAIEDPYYRKRNLSRCISNYDVYSYIWTRLKSAYKYFGVPQTKDGPLFLNLDSKDLKTTQTEGTVDSTLELSDFSSQEEQESADEGEDENEDHLNWKKRSRRRRRNTSDASKESVELEGHPSSSDEELLEDHDPDISLDELKLIENLHLEDEQKLRTESESSDVGPQRVTPKKKSASVSPLRKTVVADRPAEKESCEKPQALPCQPNEDHNSTLQESELCYKFDKDILTDKKTPPLYCGECGVEGHLQNECPSFNLPLLKELSPLPVSYLKQLDEACSQVMCNHAPSKKEVENRKGGIEELEEYIQNFFPNASLELFGSSCNGFGFAGSDMDICLTFTDSKEKELDHAGIIDGLANILKSHPIVYNILAITTAKVPIVKFNYRCNNLNLECDISLYNTLAQHNTRMLLTYSKIDERVKVLGYTVKLFVKLCNIGDASRGSLSSYAYILMVIYYLQQRKPAVLPVLQELYPKDGTAPEAIVDGWNAWFYEDIENLATVWPEIGQNTESIGELWLGFLRFYTEDFDFKTSVVSIRRKALLTRIEKFWNVKVICIEDPFELNHNLGVGVSRKMSTYIMKALIRGRELFGTSFEDLDTPNLKNFLFDRQKLATEAPPNDRGCRICGKIGHKMKECPNRRTSRNARRRWQESSQQERKGRNDKQRNPIRDENRQKSEQNRTRVGKPQAPTIVKNCKLMEQIVRHLESNQ